jgi:hypothetical protein
MAFDGSVGDGSRLGVVRRESWLRIESQDLIIIGSSSSQVTLVISKLIGLGCGGRSICDSEHVQIIDHSRLACSQKLCEEANQV